MGNAFPTSEKWHEESSNGTAARSIRTQACLLSYLKYTPSAQTTFISYPIQNVCIVQLPLLYRNHLCSSSSTLLLQHLLLRPLAGLCVSHGAVTLAGPLDKSLLMNTRNNLSCYSARQIRIQKTTRIWDFYWHRCNRSVVLWLTPSVWQGGRGTVQIRRHAKTPV